mmetsp:Transcript_13406/g.26611  ORF Transcript_13406/g.26611 Transcript_13406/m.26611 type:complete len:220 (+) Transcript_13406:908-1567(+)
MRYSLSWTGLKCFFDFGLLTERVGRSLRQRRRGASLITWPVADAVAKVPARTLAMTSSAPSDEDDRGRKKSKSSPRHVARNATAPPLPASKIHRFGPTFSGCGSPSTTKSLATLVLISAEDITMSCTVSKTPPPVKSARPLESSLLEPNTSILTLGSLRSPSRRFWIADRMRFVSVTPNFGLLSPNATTTWLDLFRQLMRLSSKSIFPAAACAATAATT